jgi:hypothetical protein
MGKTKTIRFAAIVERVGQPEAYVLWRDPKRDALFQSALQENRIMTVQREPRGTEFGLVGFKRRQNSSYLLFPKGLSAFEGNRVVGIKYELFTPSKPIGKKVVSRQKAAIPKPPAPSRSRPHQFEITFRVTATTVQTLIVEAPNLVEAKRTALAAASERPPAFSGNQIKRRLLRVQRKLSGSKE